eukprot:3877485-Rhodomonas_salina.2
MSCSVDDVDAGSRSIRYPPPPGTDMTYEHMPHVRITYAVSMSGTDIPHAEPALSCTLPPPTHSAYAGPLAAYQSPRPLPSGSTANRSAMRCPVLTQAAQSGTGGPRSH